MPKLEPARDCVNGCPGCNELPRELFRVADGFAKLVWFRILKNSARNCKAPVSPRNGKGVSFAIEKSSVLKFGPLMIPREALPRNPAG